jgi:hypothetical protein
MLDPTPGNDRPVMGAANASDREGNPAPDIIA